MGIGPGAKIVIVRSGVIPHIVDVTHHVWLIMPDESYVWTEGNTDIMLAINGRRRRGYFETANPFL